MWAFVVSTLKYIAGAFVISIAWAFCWWMLLVWVSTPNFLVMFLLVINCLVLHGFVGWSTKQSRSRGENDWFAVVLTIIVLFAIGWHTHMSSQWLFEDITGLISNFTGTISFMFNYTRQNVDVIKLIGYIGCIDYMYLFGSMTYVWARASKRRVITDKK